MFKHVILQSFFQTGFQADNPALKSSFQTLEFSLDHVTALIRAMKKVVTQLSSSGTESHWAGYSENRSYTAPEIEAKQRFVEKHLQDIQPNSVWDLGCNTGEFSLIARKYADLVIAADADPESVNRLYRYCRGKPNFRDFAVGPGCDESLARLRMEQPRAAGFPESREASRRVHVGPSASSLLHTQCAL